MSTARVFVIHARPAVKPAQSTLRKTRNISDLTITRTGKALFRQSGGRSALGGHCVTVFGATGFLGRYIVNRMGRTGCQIVIPFREEMSKRHLKVTGDLGRISFMEMDLRNTDSLEAAVRHSDVVINMIGREWTTKNFSYEDVHIEGTQRIAEAVAKYDVDRFIHLSSYNADPNSTSGFYRTKGISELVAREIFPETTIVRPSRMFGFEDNFLHKHASHHNLVTSNNAKERLYPVHVVDVGRALEAMIYDDSTAGQTYELYGPKSYSIKEVRDIIERETRRPKSITNIPKKLNMFYRGALDYLWWPNWTPDHVEREFIDQKIDPTAKTFADLGIERIDDIADKALEYVRHYRSSAFYDLPPMTAKEKAEEKKYLHVQDDVYS